MARTLALVGADHVRAPCLHGTHRKGFEEGARDPSIGLKVESAAATLAALTKRGLNEQAPIVKTARGAYAVIHDPEGRSVILTEMD